MNGTNPLAEAVRPVIRWLELFGPLAHLGIRLWLANLFWQAGIYKVGNMEATIQSFENDYAVPLLSPVVAAYLATAVELIFSVLLAVGLAGRFAAAVLFSFIVIALVSYPFSPADVAEHQLWGLMLLLLVFYGPGKISIDHFIRRRYLPETIE